VRIRRVWVRWGRAGVSALKLIASTRKAEARANDWSPSGSRRLGEEWRRSTRPERRKEAWKEVRRRVGRNSSSLVRDSQGMHEPGGAGSGGRPTKSLISSLLCLLQLDPTTTTHLKPRRIMTAPGKI